VTCREAHDLLSAYVDRELDLAASLPMQAHLRDCASCRAALERAEALRAAFAAATLSYPAPPDLAPRVRAALRRDARSGAGRVRWLARWAPIPLAAAAAAALTWAVAVRGPGPSPESGLRDELVAGHVRALMVDHLVDVTSSDQHTVRPWFNGKIDFAPPVADFTADGFPLVGGRVDYIGGRPVAALVYGRRQHTVNVFVWPSSSGDRARRELAAQGYHLLGWNDGGLQYWAVSDLNTHELEALADLMRQ
jgi:anti-sigma factor RsiW